MVRTTAGTDPARRRLAWLSPLPPTPSGISDYSAELLPEIARRYEVELVVDPAAPFPTDLAGRHLTLTLGGAVERHRERPFDLFVYQVGDSHRHHFMLPFLGRFPGLVVLHDVHLGNFVAGAAVVGKWPVSLADELRLNGEETVADWADAGRVGPDEVADMCRLNRRVLDAADAVIVHSAYGWAEVRRSVDVPVGCVPLVMPLPGRVPRAELRARFGLPAAAFVVCTLGVVAPTKRVGSLITAVAGLPPPLRDQTLVLVVGPVDPKEAERLVTLSRDLGVADRVRFTGAVPLTDFSGYAAAADVCVQLRYPTHGEVSAALLRAMAAGAACLVSDEGTMRELPDDVVGKIRSPAREVEDLRAAMGRFAASPGQRQALAEAARRYVGDRHSPRCAAAAMSAVIDQTLDRRAACRISPRAIGERPRLTAAGDYSGSTTASNQYAQKSRMAIANWRRSTGFVM